MISTRMFVLQEAGLKIQGAYVNFFELGELGFLCRLSDLKDHSAWSFHRAWQISTTLLGTRRSLLCCKY